MVGPEDRSVAQIVYKVRIYWALLCARYPEKKRKGNSRGADKDPKECKKRKSFSLLASRVPSVLRRALFMAGGGGCGGVAAAGDNSQRGEITQSVSCHC